MQEIELAASKIAQSCITAPPVMRSLQASVKNSATPISPAFSAEKIASKTRAAKKSKKARRLKRSKSASSGDGDNSEGVESCFESIGAPSECEHVTVRKKRAQVKMKSSKAKAIKAETRCKKTDVKTLGDSQRKEEMLVEVKQDPTETLQRDELKLPRSPLLLNKPQVKATPDFGNGVTMENLTTFWTPIGRVIVAPIASDCSTGLKLPGSPSSPVLPSIHLRKQSEGPEEKADFQEVEEEAKQKTTSYKLPRSFLVPPRSPRPPNTRRLGNDRDPLSRSELYPPQYERKNETLLSIPSQYNPSHQFLTDVNGRNIAAAGGVGNISLSLSLPLPSPMKLDAFTSELLARCTGVTYDHNDFPKLPLAYNPGRRSSVDDVFKNENGDVGREDYKRKALPSPGDPFIASPSEEERMDLSASVRPSLPHTHPATLRPSTPSNSHRVSGTEDLGPSRCTPQYPNSGHYSENNHRFVDVPRHLPPPLPPRPRGRLDPVTSVQGLREELVANGALVSGDDNDAVVEDIFRKSQRYECRDEDGRKHRHKHEHRREHGHHNHKTATIFSKKTLEDEDIVIIPIKKTYTDEVIEHERACSLQTAIAQQQHGRNEHAHTRASRARDLGCDKETWAQLPVTTSSSYLRQRLDSHVNERGRQASGGRPYYDEHKKSGFELLKRQHDASGYTMREGCQERGRGRDRNERRERGRCENEMGRHDEMMIVGGGEEEEREQEDEQGAIRLGEHKRGFDKCEIQKWLDGLRKARREQEHEQSKTEMDMDMEVC